MEHFADEKQFQLVAECETENATTLNTIEQPNTTKPLSSSWGGGANALLWRLSYQKQDGGGSGQGMEAVNHHQPQTTPAQKYEELMVGCCLC
mmetsp:Transcript_1468/g.2676  ORF Transcript_1468/g.2676 Transcript_1468/m.2676 type:complete len:92 (+) Transcript_1468:443-718(+)